MKGLLGEIVVATTLVWSAPASGADYSWTGFYLGLNAGAGFNASSYTLTPAGAFLTGGFPATNPQRTDSADLGGAAFSGGLQGGYNWQVEVRRPRLPDRDLDARTHRALRGQRPIRRRTSLDGALALSE
ncbi:MAG: hypothetical protein ACRELZ_03625 [Candidatus Rokuibacteriota bacterium]